MPRGGSRSSVEKKKRNEDEELERAFLQIEARQSPSKRQRGGQKNRGSSSSSLRSPCRVHLSNARFESFEEQKSEPNHISVSSIVRDVDCSLQAKFEKDNLMRKHVGVALSDLLSPPRTYVLVRTSLSFLHVGLTVVRKVRGQ